MRLRDHLPGFGEHAAIDSTTVRTHSNPDRHDISDGDASWTAKSWASGRSKKKWYFGYKLHAIVCSTYELPISVKITTAKGADSLTLAPLLEEATSLHDWFTPASVSLDKGYDARHCYETILGYGAVPIIPMRAMRPGAVRRRQNSEVRTAYDRSSKEWRRLYARRTAVERVFGRLKENRRLERHCYRGFNKVEAHCLLAVITMQLKALIQIAAGGALRTCVRNIA